MELDDTVRRDHWECSRGAARKAIESKLVEAIDAALASVASYDDLYRAADRVVAGLRERGFELQLFDEDGESTVTVVEARPDRTGLVIEFIWDEAEGANALPQFP